MTRNALPTFYYLFFGFFEPTLILIGAYLCIVTPEKYADALLPIGTESVTRIMGATSRGQMVIGGLGSSMLALSMFPLIKNNLGSNPVVQEKMVKGLLVPLAIADLSHIIMCLLPLPMSLLKTPSKWTGTFHGNITLTIFLFSVRMAYFMGIGRGQKLPMNATGEPRKSHGQASLPLQPDAGRIEVVKTVELVEASPAKKRASKAKA